MDTSFYSLLLEKERISWRRYDIEVGEEEEIEQSKEASETGEETNGDKRDGNGQDGDEDMDDS